MKTVENYAKDNPTAVTQARLNESAKVVGNR